MSTKNEKDQDKQDRNLAGRLLLAMPSLGDPRFQRAVIFVCAHDEKGAMGLVINHALPGLDIAQLMKQLHIEPGATPDEKMIHFPVLNGGPVETARGFILHSSDYSQPDTVRIDEHFSVTGTIDALKAIASGDGPDKMLFVLGYAGWSAGQLDQELQENAWLVTEADPDLIFTTDVDTKWNAAVRKIGIDPAMLSSDAGRA